MEDRSGNGGTFSAGGQGEKVMTTKSDGAAFLLSSKRIDDNQISWCSVYIVLKAD